MEIVNGAAQTAQTDLEVKLLKQEIDAQKDYADAVLKMGQSVTSSIDLHVNKASGGHLDAFA